MKRKTIVIIICAVLLTVAFVSELFREVSERARDVQVNDVCQKLSIEVKIFRGEEGHYPRSLLELESGDYQDEKYKKSVHELIGITQHNAWHDTYDYIPSTNGYTIIVTGPVSGPAGWFGKQRSIEKHYDVGGEELRQ